MRAKLKPSDLPMMNESWKSLNPYPGEGEIIIASNPDEYGFVKCIHALHQRHKSLNGSVEEKHISDILRSYGIVK